MTTQLIRPVLKPAGLFAVLVLLLLLASTAPTATYAAPKQLVDETFRNATAAGWNLVGTACLTAGSVSGACAVSPNNEGNGNGWLRLTSNTNSQSGSAIYNTAFPSTNGIVATFTYATYGGNGADGFTFYLIDGATAVPTTGGTGSALGYSRLISPAEPGVTNGIIGIGLDEYGAFSSTGAGDCNPSCPGGIANSVTIRGSGNLNTGFNYLTRGGATIPTGNRAGAKRVRITITPGATKYITVEMNSGSGFVTIINNFNLSTAIGQVALPATLKMGFSGSTGAANNFHEIRDLTVGGAQPTTLSLICAPNPTTLGQSVTCTAAINESDPATPSGTMMFNYNGNPVPGCTNLPVAGNIVQCSTVPPAVGVYDFIAVYSGDATFAESTSPVVAVTVNAPTAVPTSAPKEVPEGDTLLLLGGGMSGLGVWLRYQWSRRRKQSN